MQNLLVFCASGGVGKLDWPTYWDSKRAKPLLAGSPARTCLGGTYSIPHSFHFVNPLLTISPTHVTILLSGCLDRYLITEGDILRRGCPLHPFCLLTNPHFCGMILVILRHRPSWSRRCAASVIQLMVAVIVESGVADDRTGRKVPTSGFAAQEWGHS